MDMPLKKQEQIIGRTKEKAREGYTKGYAQAWEYQYGRPMDEYEIGAMMDRFEEYWTDMVLRTLSEKERKKLRADSMPPEFPGGY